MTTNTEEMIARGREIKARRYARALWDQWPAGSRAAELSKLEAKPQEFWDELADSIGARKPSADTIALVLSKLRQATRDNR